MSDLGTELDAQDVRALFQELSDRLAANGVHAQLFVVGGAAMALAYDSGRLTRDVDALFVPAPEVRQAAEAIGAARGLEPDWLNDAAKGFLLGYTTAQQGIDLLTNTYPTDRLLPRHRYVVQDVAERAAARHTSQSPMPRQADPRLSEAVPERRSKLAPPESFGRTSGLSGGHQPPSLGR